MANPRVVVVTEMNVEASDKFYTRPLMSEGIGVAQFMGVAEAVKRASQNMPAPPYDLLVSLRHVNGYASLLQKWAEASGHVFVPYDHKQPKGGENAIHALALVRIRNEHPRKVVIDAPPPPRRQRVRDPLAANIGERIGAKLEAERVVPVSPIAEPVRAEVVDDVDHGATETDAIVYWPYKGTMISMSTDDFVDMTAMWRANGSEANRRPVDYLKTDRARDLIAQIQREKPEVVSGHVALHRTEKGGTSGGGCTKAFWKLAIDYGMYLNPEFHSWCLERIGTYIDTRMRGKAQPDTLDAEMIRFLAQRTDAKFVEQSKQIETVRAEIGPVAEAVRELDGKVRLLVSTSHPGRGRLKRGQLSLPTSDAIVAFRKRDVAAYAKYMIDLAQRDALEWAGDRGLFTKIHGRIWQMARGAAKCKKGWMGILGDNDLCRLQGVLHSAARAIGKLDLCVDIGDWTPTLN